MEFDFGNEMEDGKYLILEVKGDHMVDDPVVKAKEAAAEEIAVMYGKVGI